MCHPLCTRNQMKRFQRNLLSNLNKGSSLLQQYLNTVSEYRHYTLKEVGI